jgi:hypothetical protein
MENAESANDKENIKLEDDKSEIKIEDDGAKPLVIKAERPEVPCQDDHDYYDKDEDPQNTDITTSSIEDIPEQLSAEEEEEDEEMREEVIDESESHKLIFNGKSELMDYISKNISVEELLERIAQAEEDESAKRKEYVSKILHTITFTEMLNEMLPLPDSKLSSMATEQIEATSNLINHISKLMKANDRVKHKVLDALSEKHSKDFLTHAIQENSTSQVCEKLTMPNIVSYIIHKVNVCDESDISFEINRMNRTIMHYLVKKTSDAREIIADQKETQELLKLLFQNKPKIDVLDTVHEFLRSNIVGQF